ncbi:hypothetical protein HII12_005171 [Brettanomyces bruxellensis]|uniref:Mtf2-like C-terminal domain-containing protein n=1 Tax=Dekkera bruxellensis TaxID=5007 RepID=A0A8H6EPP7_DEKBR|nr:hypothetical protein HII12_005171 [Brettanomyces bruxellensis]
MMYGILKISRCVQTRCFSCVRPMLKESVDEGIKAVEKGPDLAKTTGEVESSEDPADFLKKIINDSKRSLKFDKIYKEFSESVSNTAPMSSFEEQKSFHKIFNYLKNEHGSIGITDTVKRITGFYDLNQNLELNGDGRDNSSVVTKQALISKKFNSNSENTHAYKMALKPTLEKINQFQNSGQMLGFIRRNLLQSFLENDEFTKNHTIAVIKEISLKKPEHPMVDRVTLPILLEYCLNSLTNDFNSLGETLVLVNYIKKHQSIELYEFGMNIDVYNSLLRQIWVKTENLQMISRIVDELCVNAIKPDLVTYITLAEIYLKCMNVKDSLNAEPYLLWGNSEDIHKISHFLENIET